MKLLHRFCWTQSLLFAAALLHAEVNTPRVGFVRYADGSVWAVNGLKANFVLGTRLVSDTKDACFTNDGGLVSIPGEIDLVKIDGSVIGRYQTDEAHPVLRIDKDLSSATIWLPSTQTLVRWNGSSFVTTAADAPDSAFHQKSFSFFSDVSGVEAQSEDGATHTLPIKAKDIKMQSMSSDWVHLSSKSLHRDWALFLGGNELQLLELPAPKEMSE